MNADLELESEVRHDPAEVPLNTRPKGLPDISSGALPDCYLSLGRWLGGLTSFVGPGNRIIASENATGQDWSKEFRIIHTVLQKCTSLCWRLLYLQAQSEDDQVFGTSPRNAAIPSQHDLIELAEKMRETVVVGQAQVLSGNVSYDDWVVWRKSLQKQFAYNPAVDRIVRSAETLAGDELPDALKKLLSDRERPGHWEPDFDRVLPKIATVLGYLEKVRSMLANDEPIKSSLVLFARVDDLIRELIEFINDRLQRYSDDSDPLFGSLDGASYTASIELRKVHAQELKGLMNVRPTPIVFARIETAYALLNDSLQMTLVNFAQLIDPSLEPKDIFPHVLSKESQSIELREHLWDVLQTVQTAEQVPEKVPFKRLSEELLGFRDKSLRYLFYKDLETVERFIEEVLITKEKKDLVPLLHRFGAYLETLLGQVNMRVVLAKHPFTPLQNQPQDTFV